MDFIPLPSSTTSRLDPSFGRQVTNVNPAHLSDIQFSTIRAALYKHDLLLFRDVTISPEEQYRLNKAFDPLCDNFGHGNNAIDANKKSILHPDLKTIPRVPQVQLIGNGTVLNHEGIPAVKLAHPSHTTFHKTSTTSPGTTRFFRWHIDAALYSQTLAPPKVTTLYGVHVPVGERQRCVYDDGTGDELDVSLGTTAFVSGKTMFDILPPQLKSLAVRTRVKYAPHPYMWMAKARALSTGLGLESEGREIEMKDLPSWYEDQIQTLPLLWTNEVTGELHLQVHPCAARELLIDPVPLQVSTEDALYPDGARLTDLKVVRELLYEMQRPGISPERVYAHEWKPKDLVLFHNRGVLHSVVGTLGPDQIRIFHQCNLAASDFPTGPSEEATHHWTT